MKRLFLIALACAIVAVPAARSSIARSPAAPDPQPFVLPAAGRVVVASGSAWAPIPIDRLAVMLALVGAPVAGTGQLADVAAIVPGPRHPIGVADLERAVDVLVTNGIARENIHAHLVSPSTAFPSLEAYMTRGAPGAAEPFDRTAPRSKIGMILIDVGAISDERFAKLEHAIDVSKDGIPTMVPADVVAYRTACDDVDLRRRASAEAFARATSLAAALGLHVDGRPDVAVRKRFVGPQVVCGAGEPTMPFSPSLDLHERHAPRFVTAYVSVGGAFGLSGAPDMTTIPIAAQVGSSIAPNWHDPGGQALVGRSVVVASDRPFASGRGTYSVLVRPDVMLISFAITHVGRDPAGVVAAMDRAAATAGVPAKDRLARQFDLIIRVDPTDRTFVDRVQKPVLAASIQPAPYPDDGADIETFPFVRDCDAYRAPLVREATRRARLRADAMAGAMSVGLGDLIGVADGGFSTDAACGYGPDAPLADLVRATPFDNYGVFRPYAQFTQSVAASWEVEEIAPDARIPSPRATPAYEVSNIDRAFVAESGGLQGSAVATLHPRHLLAKSDGASYVDDDCEAETTAALRDAVRAAASKAGTRRVHALIDLGTTWDFNDDVCYFALPGYGARDSRTVTATENVTVVP